MDVLVNIKSEVKGKLASYFFPKISDLYYNKNVIFEIRILKNWELETRKKIVLCIIILILISSSQWYYAIVFFPTLVEETEAGKNQHK